MDELKEINECNSEQTVEWHELHKFTSWKLIIPVTS